MEAPMGHPKTKKRVVKSTLKKEEENKVTLISDEEISIAGYVRNEIFSDILLCPLYRKEDEKVLIPAHRIILAKLEFFRVALSSKIGGDLYEFQGKLALKIKLVPSILYILLDYLYNVPNPLKYLTLTGSSLVDIFQELAPFKHTELLRDLWKSIISNKDTDNMDEEDFLATLHMAVEHDLPFPIPCKVNTNILSKLTKLEVLHLLKQENVEGKYHCNREICIRLFWAGAWCIIHDNTASRDDKIQVMKAWYDSWIDIPVKDRRNGQLEPGNILPQILSLGECSIFSSVMIDFAINKKPRVFTQKTVPITEQKQINIAVSRKIRPGEKIYCSSEGCKGDHTPEEQEKWNLRRQSPATCVPNKYNDTYAVPAQNQQYNWFPVDDPNQNETEYENQDGDTVNNQNHISMYTPVDPTNVYPEYPVISNRRTIGRRTIDDTDVKDLPSVLTKEGEILTASSVKEYPIGMLDKRVKEIREEKEKEEQSESKLKEDEKKIDGHPNNN